MTLGYNPKGCQPAPKDAGLLVGDVVDLVLPALLQALDRAGHDGLGGVLLCLNSKAAANAERPELKALLEYAEGNGIGDDELLRRIEEKVVLATADKEVRAQVKLEDKHALDLRDTERKSKAEGEERMCELSKLLLSENRIEDLRRATDDAVYRERLFLEYELK